MRKKYFKIIFLFMIMFTLSGCNVVYNLDISNNKIIESSNFYIEDIDMEPYTTEDDVATDETPYSSIDELVDIYYKEDYSAFDYDFDGSSNYKKEKITDSNGQGINYKYVYNFENFKDSSLFSNSFSTNPYTNDKKYITINIENLSPYFFNDSGEVLNNLTINIKTKLKVEENNADSVNGNVYTWNIDSGDVEEKSVYIKIKKGFNYRSIIIGIGIVIGLGLIITLVIFNIRKKIIENNDI